MVEKNVKQKWRVLEWNIRLCVVMAFPSWIKISRKSSETLNFENATKVPIHWFKVSKEGKI